MNKRERLARIIGKGKLHFILVRGVLRWGLVSATLVGTWEFFSKGRTAKEVVMPFIVLPPIGILWGEWMWHWVQRRYEKALADDRNQ